MKTGIRWKHVLLMPSSHYPILVLVMSHWEETHDNALWCTECPIWMKYDLGSLGIEPGKKNLGYHG